MYTYLASKAEFNSDFRFVAAEFEKVPLHPCFDVRHVVKVECMAVEIGLVER